MVKPRPVRESGGLSVSGEVAGILLAGFVGAAGGGVSARVLPSLAFAVPMEAELGKIGANGLGGGFGELDPNPFADNFGKLELARHPALEQFQNAVGGQLSVAFALLEIEVRTATGTKLS